jgi:hypothetical protein
MPADDPKYFNKSKPNKSIQILRKVKRFKIKVIISMLCANYDPFCSIFQPYFYCITNAVRAILAYFDLFLVINMGC